jgi:hypothetical protein
MTKMRVYRGGAWVDQETVARARIGGAWVDYGPDGGGGGEESLFTSQVPSGSFQDGVALSLGTQITFAVAGSITQVRWYAPSTLPGSSVFANVFGLDALKKAGADATFSGLVSSTWCTATLSSAVAVTAGQTLVPTIRTPSWYVASTASTTPASPFPVTNGNLSTPTPAGFFTAFGGDGSVQWPDSNSNNGCYFVDVVFIPD